MVENKAVYACGRCGATDLPYSVWRLYRAGEKPLGLCTVCANALRKDSCYVTHLGTLTIRTRMATWADEGGDLLAVAQKCIKALVGFGDIVVPVITDTVSMMIVTMRRWELQEYLARRGLPARLASFIASRLPEWCLRLLAGRVIAVDLAVSEEDESGGNADG